MTRPHLHAMLLALALAVAGAPLRAETAADVAQARDLFMEGSRLTREGKWEEAREHFERSLKLKRSALTLYSLGMAQKNTGRTVEALETLRAFRVEGTGKAAARYQKPAAEAIAELEKQVGHLTISIAPAVAGRSIAIDGEAIPNEALDQPRPVNAGEHRVVATAPGHREARATIAVAPGQTETVSLKLVPLPATAAPAPAARTDSDAMRDAPKRPNRTAGYVLVGSGAALFAAGATIGIIGIAQMDDAPSEDSSEADSARKKALIGDIVGGVGLVTAAIGVVVLLSAGGDQRARAPTLDVWVGAGRGGLSGRF